MNTDNKRKIIFTLGLPASGKSTWAKQYIRKNPNFKRIERDMLREMFNDYNLKDKGIEDLVTLAVKSLIFDCFAKGYNVILSDTNLNIKFRNKLIEEVTSWKQFNFDVDIEYKDFTDVPLEVCLERNRKRKGYKRVPEKVIKDMYKKWINPEYIEKDKNLFTEIIQFIKRKFKNVS